MTLDSTISLVITFFAVILIALFVVSPFFGLWWAISNYRIRKQAYKYLQSPEFQKDMEELKEEAEIGYSKKLKGGIDGIQKKGTEDRTGNSNTSTFGRAKETFNLAGYRQDAGRKPNIEAVNRPTNTSFNENRRKIKLN
jgi:hypothetical protein